MAEASRGFLPRNSDAFADPRGRIVIDDAKSFFAAAQPPLRHHRLRALQPLGERRLEPVHARVLPPRRAATSPTAACWCNGSSSTRSTPRWWRA